MSTTDPIDVTIKVDPARAGGASFDEVVRTLQGLGLANVLKHPSFAMVSGSAPAAQLDVLGRVSGVVSIRKDQTYGPG
jgi:hypothetical protein